MMLNEKLTSIASLKLRLMDTFPTEFPALSSMNFQIGYLEPPSQAKRWLCELRDLQQMYKDLPSCSKITLWCEAILQKCTQHQCLDNATIHYVEDIL